MFDKITKFNILDYRVHHFC